MVAENGQQSQAQQPQVQQPQVQQPPVQQPQPQQPQPQQQPTISPVQPTIVRAPRDRRRVNEKVSCFLINVQY